MSNTNSSSNNILTNLMSAINHSSSSLMSLSGDNGSIAGSGRPQPILQGYLHKLHKMRTKRLRYFVVFEDTPDTPGRLEYFDSERKFRSNQTVNTKRSIILRSCFNINRRSDTKYKFIIGLYRKDDCFSIILKDDEELNKWLKVLLGVQRGKEMLDGDQPRPIFEHVWEVSVKRRGLGESYGILDSYRLCLTDTTVSLVRIGPPTTSSGEHRVEHVSFPLVSVRRCGATEKFFFLEVGRFSMTGAGEIWMLTSDQVIAENMRFIILETAAKRNKDDNLAPMMRHRSQSANESSKPLMYRRSTVTGLKPTNFSPAESLQQILQSDSSFSATSTCTVVMTPNALNSNDLTELLQPMFCEIAMISEMPDDVVMLSDTTTDNDSHNSYANMLPNQENRIQEAPHLLNNSDSSNNASSTTAPSTTNASMVCHQRAFSLPSASPMLNLNNYQNTSVINHHVASNQSVGNSPMITGKSFAIQPVHQRTRSLPLTEENAIKISLSPPHAFYLGLNAQKLNNNSMDSIIEDHQSTDNINNNNNNYQANTGGNNSSILKHLTKIANSTNSLGGTSGNVSSPSQLRKKRHHHNVITAPLRSTAALSRERCDSFPSVGRTRAISENTSDVPPTNQPQLIRNGNKLNNNNMPPPPSRIPERSQSMFNHRYNASQSPPVNSSPPSGAYSTEESGGSSVSIDDFDGLGRTPEEYNSSFNFNSSFSSRVPIPEESESIWRNNNTYGNTNNAASLSLPYIQSQRRGSPNPPPINYNDPYMEMGPYSNSPRDAMGNNYMPMSPGVDFRERLNTNTSGATSNVSSSLIEDNDGYVPMQPTTNGTLARIQTNADDEMNRVHSSNQLASIVNAGDLSSATSSCSITSGTPSTDMRFSEYHLEKVAACFTPSEDDDQLDRPLRTYSVGSKLECNSIRKPQIDRIANEHTNTRVRAFSVGSRAVKVTRAELTSRSGNHTPSHNSPTAMNQYQRQEINNNVSNAKGKKSSSVPALTNGGVANRSGSGVGGAGGHGSFDHMDDLMEIDFSSSRSIESVTRVNNKPIKNSLPVNIPSKSDDYMNMTGRSASKNSSVSGYVEMKPGRVQTLSECNDYMDMKPGKNSSSARYSNASSLSSSPVKTSSNPRTVSLQTTNQQQQQQQQQNSSNYMDMSPRNYEHNNHNHNNRRTQNSNNRMTSSSISSLSSSAKAPSDDYLNMSPVSKSILHVKLPKENEGYMEMSWKNKNKNNKNNQKSLNENHTENPSSSSDEYINMDYSNNNDAGSTSSQSSCGKDRSMSRPITIQNQMTSSLSPTQLTINHNHNRTRYDSRDSGIVTPSSESQPTIFPFSPGSPSLKQFVDSQEQRKCLVDGSTGTIRLSEDEILEEDPRTPVPVDHSMVRKQLEILSSDYAIMNLGEPVSKKPNLTSTPVSKQSPESSTNSSAQSHFILNQESNCCDYINCIPSASTTSSSKIVTPKPIKSSVLLADDTAGDYALMNPFKKIASPLPKSSNDSESKLSQNVPQTASKKSLLLQLSSQEKLNSNSCFKPIVEDQNSTTSSHHPVLCRQSSEKQGTPRSSGYEVLVRPNLSRPNSVNSTKILRSNSNTSTNRPNSENNFRLGCNSTSSSTSTLCGESSSNLRHMDISGSSSAVASPMSLTSRPESVSSDILMTSRPPSVSDRSELHYASLDLPSTYNDDPKIESDSNQQQQQQTFSYAQIDFVQSENLKSAIQQQLCGDKQPDNNAKK